MKIEKSFITPKWQKIKAMYQAGTNGSDKYGTNFEIKGELDILCTEFIDLVGEITHKRGFDCVVEEIHMNLWKERIWSLYENAGLLPEIAWRDDKESDRLEEEDKWNRQEEDDFNYDSKSNDYEPTDEELMEIETL